MVILPRPRRLIREYDWGRASPNPSPNPRQIILARMAKLARMNRFPKLTRLPRQTTMTRLAIMHVGFFCFRRNYWFVILSFVGPFHDSLRPTAAWSILFGSRAAMDVARSGFVFRPVFLHRPVLGCPPPCPRWFLFVSPLVFSSTFPIRAVDNPNADTYLIVCAMRYRRGPLV